MGRLAVLATTALCLLQSCVAQQKPLVISRPQQQNERRLTGRFLQITDIHPDPFYKVYSNTEDESACHRGKGPAGLYGAETTDCDTPFELINSTFRWIDEHLKDDIDFVVWTGDSARHDNDEKIPRNEDQVVSQNKFLIHKFEQVFGKEGKDHSGQDHFTVPIIPTLGNNDILPHNIFSRGPNKWTKKYAAVWKKFVPEEQRHQFARGGWFYVEVIPNRLAVFSLNTLYFFTSNAAVDGCSASSEPGYEHFEWLRIQLQFLRDRGMKAILMGHVPPARNDAKSSWDETCWQKYALWLRQYRDVVVGGMFGHMNIDHFILQDFNDIKWTVSQGLDDTSSSTSPRHGPEFTVQGVNDYLMELRKDWSKLPDRPKASMSSKRRFMDEIGGEFAERFAVSYVSPSVVPNYFPTLRIYEYNITGLEHLNVYQGPPLGQEAPQTVLPSDVDSETSDFNTEPSHLVDEDDWEVIETSETTEDEDRLSLYDRLASLFKKHKKKKKHHKKKKKRPKFTVPRGPAKSAPPGPAYSPQPLSLTGIRQYYANLTYINNDFVAEVSTTDDWDAIRWQPGKHKDKKPKKPHPNPNDFAFQVEYDTRDKGDIYHMARNGLSVRRFVELASRIADYEAGSQKSTDTEDDDHVRDEKHKKKKKKKKKKKTKIINKTWFTFVDRATVATLDDDELHREFGDPV